MKLIADSGSTKTDWCLIDNNGDTKTFLTGGINPYYQSTKEITKLLHTEFPVVEGKIEDIFFYGAGCANEEKNEMVENALRSFFKVKNISVESDLLGAARSLCLDTEGIVCILGTGSNSCHYKDGYIVKNVSPLGYKLGDEGSGAVIGEKLVSDILKKQLSEPTIQLFFNTYGTKASEIMDNVYQKTFPNRYLAQFTKFISDHIYIKELEDIVLYCFEEFIRRNLLQYNSIHYQKIYFTGSVAHHFKEQLVKVANKNSLIVGDITQSPMEGLIKFHCKRNLSSNKREMPSHSNISVTESPSAFDHLEKMSVKELISGINSEDARVHLAVKQVLPQIEQLIERIIERMEQGGRVFYLGAGTSGRLGVLDASELPPTFGVPDNMVIGLIAGGDTALRKAVEAAEDDPDKAWKELQDFNINKKDTVIGIAASGTTPYVIGGIEHARKNGLLTGCITCNPNSKVASAAEFPIEAIVGPEFVTGSTRMKAGTAQKMILNIMTTTIMIKLGRVKGNKMVNMQLTNAKLIKRGSRMIMDELQVPYDEAKRLLLLYGSVKKAIEAQKQE